ncbi:MAG: MoaD/ThiS family protein [Deltaproteobacteria bacterium]|nr:MAG: MoaD/ThiS family protein [Deltaproteobacteria bacterium]
MGLHKFCSQLSRVPYGSDAKDLIHQLGIPLEEVGLLSVNKRQATLDQRLEQGDVIYIIPPIGGG